MNESALLQLKVIVERAVRPVKATISRKRKMREELLAHVISVFEEELPQCSDEATALNQVEKRFGDPKELAQNLQVSISMINRFEFLVGRCIGPKPGESLVRRAGRCGLIVFVTYLLLFNPLFWVVMYSAKADDPSHVAPLVTLLTVGIEHCIRFGGLVFLGTLLTNGLQKKLFGASERPLQAISLLSCLVTAALAMLYSVVLSSLMTSTRLAEYVLNVRPSIFLDLLVVFQWVFIWLANMVSSERWYRDDWKQLTID